MPHFLCKVEPLQVAVSLEVLQLKRGTVLPYDRTTFTPHSHSASEQGEVGAHGD